MMNVVATEHAPAAVGPYSQGNIAAIAVAADTSLDKSVKVTIFLTDIHDFKQVNEIYATIFREPYPARSAIQVAALPLSADIEIEAVIAT